MKKLINFYHIPTLRHLPFLILGILVAIYQPSYFYYSLAVIIVFQLISTIIYRKFAVAGVLNCILFIFPFITISQQPDLKNPYSNSSSKLKGNIIVEEIWKQTENKIQFKSKVVINKHPTKVLVYGKLKKNDFINLKDTIKSDGFKIRPLPEFVINDFDYGAYLEEKQIQKIIYLDSNYYKKSPENLSFLNRFNHWRNNKIQTIINSKLLSETSKSIYLALGFGDRSLLTYEAKQKYIKAGIFHVLAISGLHVGIVYLVLLFFTNKLLLNNKWIQLTIIVTVLGIYTQFSGGSISVYRAFFMFTLIHIGNNFALHQKTINTTLFVALILLLYNPLWITELGFLLSFAAVFGIILWYRKISIFLNKPLPKLPKIIHKIISYSIDLLSVGIASFLATSPILLYELGVVYPIGIIAGVIFIPIFTVLVVLVILSTCITWEPIYTILMQIIDWFINLLDFLISKVARFSYAIELSISLTQALGLSLLLLVFFQTKSTLTQKLSMICFCMILILFF